MTSISMCVNHLCPLAKTCKRYTATPSKYNQSMAYFVPMSKDRCDYHKAQDVDSEG